ncbi:unnamed protein product, partial [Adineta ricciae]
DKGSVDHERYIKEVLPVALKYGNKIFGDDWIYQQDGATAHTHNLTQKWCKDNFPSFLDKEYWPPNSPDLNSLDYSIWDEFVQQMNWDNVQSKKTLINELKRTAIFLRIFFHDVGTPTCPLHTGIEGIFSLSLLEIPEIFQRSNYTAPAKILCRRHTASSAYPLTNRVDHLVPQALFPGKNAFWSSKYCFIRARERLNST